MKDADHHDRMGFIKKVYSILAIQLTLTAVMVGVVVNSTVTHCWPSRTNCQYLLAPSLAAWMWDNIWLEIMALFVAIFIEIALICCRHVGRKSPINFILLMIFTACEAYAVSCSCIYYSATSPGVVIQAFAGTALITLACTLYAFTTKNDFTTAGAAIWILCMSLFFLIMISWVFVWEGNTFAYNIVLALCVMILGFFLIHDT